MTAKTRILQLAAGPMQVRSIQVLQEAGYEVYAADANPDAPGFAVADGSAAINILNCEEVADYAKSVQADLILAVIEAGLYEAAEASQQLGLPGIAPDIALRNLDKGIMRDCWKRAGLLQPEYFIGKTNEELFDAAKAIGYPLIVKPTQGWGSRGVSQVRGEPDLEWAIEFARENSRTHQIIIEELIHGTEMTIEGLVQDGKVQVLAKSDKEHQEHERFCVAMALNYQAGFEKSVLDEADRKMNRALEALGLENGAFHCECMVNEAGIYLLESGARGGGGHIYSTIVEAASGVRMPVAQVRILLGEEVDIRPRFQRDVCYKFFSPPCGIFQEIRGLDESKKMPGILDMGFQVEPGTCVEAIPGDADRPGFVVASGATREEAIERADRAILNLTYVTE